MKQIVAVLILVIGLGIGGTVALRTWNTQRVNARANEQAAEFNENIDNLFFALQTYKERIGSYPVGNNADVVRALMGNNSKNLIILVGRKRDLDTKGQFVDPWGTPIRIYFSGEGILVRSAGPNKRFDDSTVSNSDDFYRSN